MVLTEKYIPSEIESLLGPDVERDSSSQYLSKEAIRERDMIEEQLASLAYSVGHDRAPKLYSDDHYIGFELVKLLGKGDEGEAAVGVSIFTVDDQILLNPLFFMEGDHMGVELLYMTDTKMMIPFHERWIDYLMSRDPIILGSPESIEEEELSEPDFSFTGQEGDGTRSGRSGGGIMLDKSSALVEADVEREVLVSALKEADNTAKEGFYDLLLSSPKVAEYFANTLPDFLDLVSPVEEREKGDKEASDLTKMLNIESDSSEGRTVEIHKEADAWMEPGEKELVLRQGYLVKDAREQCEMNEIDRDFSVKTIGDCGAKTVLKDTSDSEEEEVLVLREATSDNGEGKILIDGDGNVFIDDLGFEKSSICNLAEVTSKIPVYKDVLEKIDGVETFSNGNDYLAISPGGPKCVLIQDVEKVIKNSDAGYSKIITKCNYSGDRGEYYILEDADDRDIGDVVIEGAIDESPDSAEKSSFKKVHIPDSWKFVSLGDSFDLDDPEFLTKYKTYDSAVSERIKLAARQAPSNKYVIEFGGERHILRDKPEVIEFLVKECSLSEDDSNKIWKDFDNIGREVYIIKEAQPMPGLNMGVEDDMTMPPEPGMGAGGAGMEELDPEVEKLRGVAERAIEEGQTGVVDLAGLSRLLSATDSTRLVSKYLGEIMSGMDKQGKLLFVLYADYSDYAEQLGKDEFEELLTGMRDSFEAIGETVLDIKESIDNPENRVLDSILA